MMEMKPLIITSNKFFVGRWTSGDRCLEHPEPATPGKALAVNMRPQDYLRAMGYPFKVVQTPYYVFNSHERWFSWWVFVDRLGRLRCVRPEKTIQGLVITPDGQRISFTSKVVEADPDPVLKEAGINADEIRAELLRKGMFPAKAQEPERWPAPEERKMNPSKWTMHPERPVIYRKHPMIAFAVREDLFWDPHPKEAIKIEFEEIEARAVEAGVCVGEPYVVFAVENGKTIVVTPEGEIPDWVKKQLENN